MSLYRRVSVRMSGDTRFRKLSAPKPNAQTLWTHLIIGEYTTAIPGVVRGGEAAIAESLRWAVPSFREAFNEIYAEGMAKPDWSARLVFLPNGLKHNPPQSPKVVMSWAKAFAELPECALKIEIGIAVKAFLEGFSEAFQKAFVIALPVGLPKAFPHTESEAGSETESSARKARSTKAEIEDWYDTQFLPKYPGPHAQAQRKAAIREIAKLTPDQRGRALANLELCKRSPEWRRDDGKFVPGPGTFFENRMHEQPPTLANGIANGAGSMPDARQIIQRQRETAA